MVSMVVHLQWRLESAAQKASNARFEDISVIFLVFLRCLGVSVLSRGQGFSVLHLVLVLYPQQAATE
jgi:hypothetical protein